MRTEQTISADASPGAVAEALAARLVTL